jgi:hypothetical protein
MSSQVYTLGLSLAETTRLKSVPIVAIKKPLKISLEEDKNG